MADIWSIFKNKADPISIQNIVFFKEIIFVRDKFFQYQFLATPSYIIKIILIYKIHKR